MRYFGSSFIEALIRVWNHLNARPGGRMSLCGLTSNCREVVGLTHLDQLWSVFETREEAVRRCGRPDPPAAYFVAESFPPASKSLFFCSATINLPDVDRRSG